MKKTNVLNIRLTGKELELIKLTALKFDLNVSEFVLSVIIPYCVKSLGATQSMNFLSDRIFFGNDTYVKI